MKIKIFQFNIKEFFVAFKLNILTVALEGDILTEIGFGGRYCCLGYSEEEKKINRKLCLRQGFDRTARISLKTVNQSKFYADD